MDDYPTLDGQDWVHEQCRAERDGLYYQLQATQAMLADEQAHASRANQQLGVAKLWCGSMRAAVATFGAAASVYVPPSPVSVHI